MDDDADRVRRHTAHEVLRSIDDQMVATLSECAESPPAATAWRLSELDREWDTDRIVEAESATMGLLGLALGALAGKRFLALPAFVGAAVLSHAVFGRYPLMPLFRRMGIRTAREIFRERYALKALRDAEILRLEDAGAAEIEQRLRQLGGEWDIERVLQTNASLIVLLGLVLATTVEQEVPPPPCCRLHLLCAARAAGLVSADSSLPATGHPHEARDRTRAIRPQGPARGLRRRPAAGSRAGA